MIDTKGLAAVAIVLLLGCAVVYALGGPDLVDKVWNSIGWSP